jgi:hypothetical protein
MKVAKFKRIAEASYLEYETVSDDSIEGSDNYVRISEYVEVEFPPLSKGEIVEQQLAALNQVEREARMRLQDVLEKVKGRRAELMALTHTADAFVS